MIHTVKGFSIVSEAEVDVFLEFPCFLYDSAAAAAKSLQSCPTLCDPRDSSPPGSPVPGILQAWGQEEKGTTKDEMAGWHHRLNGREFEWTPGVGDGQGGLVCCSSWGHRVRHDWATELKWCRWHHPYGRKWRTTKEPLDENERGEKKAGLKLNIRKTKIMASSPITSWQTDGVTMETETLFSWAPKSLQMVIVAMKLKDAYSLEEKLWPT